MQEEAYFTKVDQYVPILSKYPEVEEEIITVLNKQRATGQPLWYYHIAIDQSYHPKEGATLT